MIGEVLSPGGAVVVVIAMSKIQGVSGNGNSGKGGRLHG